MFLGFYFKMHCRVASGKSYKKLKLLYLTRFFVTDGDQTYGLGLTQLKSTLPLTTVTVESNKTITVPSFVCIVLKLDFFYCTRSDQIPLWCPILHLHIIDAFAFWIQSFKFVIDASSKEFTTQILIQRIAQTYPFAKLLHWHFSWRWKIVCLILIYCLPLIIRKNLGIIQIILHNFYK